MEIRLAAVVFFGLLVMLAVVSAPESDAGRAQAPPGGAPAPVALLRALTSAPAGGARADEATRPLVGRPYVFSPLGEGEGTDPDPRFRLDAFDCWTFVETAAALGSAATLDDARLALDDIRYRGDIDFGHRNHEVVSQWIPANVEKGWVTDASAEIAGRLARTAEVEYSPERWADVARAGNAIRGLAAERLPVGRFPVHYVEIANLASVEMRVPEGAIVLVIREDARDRATRVTHAGLAIVHADGARWVRHASSSAGIMRVVEEPFGRFVAHQRRALPWRLSGLGFLAVRDNQRRLEALRSAARLDAPPSTTPPPAGGVPAPAAVPRP